MHGPEIGVASTKAFTTQITVLTMIALRLASKGYYRMVIFIFTGTRNYPEKLKKLKTKCKKKLL
jgi:glucosamine--fructose-6-phosphate aminotransferase (isomerizing)